MSRMWHACTLSVPIDRGPEAVASFIANPLNLPQWATAFCKSASRQGEAWLLETPQGSVTIRFTPPNPFGVVDHVVTLPSGQEVHVPMRVVANGEGSEVLFTLFRLPDMSERQFEQDKAMVAQDLQALKRLLEDQAGRS